MKNNKKIAEFLGFKEAGYETMWLWEDKKRNTIYEGKSIPFHKDWNYLMMAVNKIEKLDYRVTINFNNCYIEKYDAFGGEEETICEYGMENSKMKAVYKCVCEFICYYNKQI